MLVAGKKEMIATRDAYGEALIALGAKNEDIVVLDADLSKSTKTNGFAKKYPERFFNVGIAEANMMGMAAGLATAGKVPFASTFALFGSLRVADTLRNSICYPNLNVKIAVTHQGISLGEDGATHQTVEDLALLRAIPNLTVIVPADAVETKAAIEVAAEIKGPVFIRLGRPKVPVIYDAAEYQFTLGKGVQLRDGNEVTVIATGIMTHMALEAAEDLAYEGISVRVINIPTIKPIDKEIILKAARETKGIVTAEEHSIYGGLGGAVAEVISEGRPTHLRRVGVMDTFGESGTTEALLKKYGLTKSNIIQKIWSIINL